MAIRSLSGPGGTGRCFAPQGTRIATPVCALVRNDSGCRKLVPFRRWCGSYPNSYRRTVITVPYTSISNRRTSRQLPPSLRAATAAWQSASPAMRSIARPPSGRKENGLPRSLARPRNDGGGRELVPFRRWCGGYPKSYRGTVITVPYTSISKRRTSRQLPPSLRAAKAAWQSASPAMRSIARPPSGRKENGLPRSLTRPRNDGGGRELVPFRRWCGGYPRSYCGTPGTAFPTVRIPYAERMLATGRAVSARLSARTTHQARICPPGHPAEKSPPFPMKRGTLRFYIAFIISGNSVKASILASQRSGLPKPKVQKTKGIPALRLASRSPWVSPM